MFASSADNTVMAQRKEKMSDQVRAAIDGCGVTRYQIAKDTGISESSLSRFVASGRGLSVQALDKVFEYLDLEIISRRRKRS